MPIELLAPAKNVEQGILALRCGADAVYVGGPRFGARKGAVNEMQDLELLVKEARLWRARVYVTLNTILFEGELEEARKAAWGAYEIGADALIVQDMAYLEMDLPDMPLHASTQAACDSPEKIAFLASVGFGRAILARELTLDHIAAIRKSTDIELEAFVYGALCVCESGHCYLSQSISGRSGNRGECAQPCRRDWSLLDGKGRVLIKDRPLLSIKDLDLSDEMGAMVSAGITGFKIEGRLKDADYIKNTVSYLRRKLDALLDARPDLSPASSGSVAHGFVPDPSKTFQRGRTKYQLSGKRQSISSGMASGHLGEYIGTVCSVAGSLVELDRASSLTSPLNPGDGLAFPGPSGRISGTLVNKVDGRLVSLQNPIGIEPGMEIFRNYDHAWHKALRGAVVDRRIKVSARLDFPDSMARLVFQDEDGCIAEAISEDPCQAPDKVEAFVQTAKDALGRLGGTPFDLIACHVDPGGFLPLSRLNALRRKVVEQLMQNRVSSHPRQQRRQTESPPSPLPTQSLGYVWNVSNSMARAFYDRHGAKNIEQAFELGCGQTAPLLMTTRLCLKYELGWCPKEGRGARVKGRGGDGDGNYYLINGPMALKCLFDCEACVMKLYKSEMP